MTLNSPSSQSDTWYVYQDWTTEEIPRCFYSGKGDFRRINRKYRNKHHSNIAKKYGFDRRIVYQTTSEQEALDKEVHFIAELHTYRYDPLYNGIGANYTIGGEGVSGHRDTEEQRQGRRKSQKESWQDPINRKNRVDARNRLETNDKLRPQASVSQKANWQDDDYREKQTLAIKIAQNVPETQEKRRASNVKSSTEMWKDESFRSKMIEVLQSEEYREKQRFAHLGKPQRCGLCREFGHKKKTCTKKI